MKTASPPKPTTKAKADRPGDSAVKSATGRAWDDWFIRLDNLGAAQLDHTRIARRLGEKQPELSPWWRQMITVYYERSRGLRVKHQKFDGSFSASVSKTVAVPLTKLYEAWVDPRTRQRWLPNAPMEIRKATKNKSLRVTWGDGPSGLDVQFLAKDPAKSQVSVDHENLPNLAAVAKSKTQWREAVARLKALLEG